jgi:serine/threonine protein kinase
MQGVVKLADFGLARAMDRATITFPNIVKGKLSYTAPELTRGHKADVRSDLYSLGVTLWESLAARKLFRGDTHLELLRAIREAKAPTLASLRPDVPPRLCAAIERAVRRDPSHRFGSAREMGAEFAAVLRSLPEPISAARLGASVVNARKRLSTSSEAAMAPGEVTDDSFDITVEVVVDYASSPSATRSIRVELSEPFKEMAPDPEHQRKGGEPAPPPHERPRSPPPSLPRKKSP